MKITKYIRHLLVLAVVLLTGSAFAGDFNLVTNSEVIVPNTAGAGAGIFDQSGFRSGGTGVIQPFLRIQANNTETGFNTSANPPPLDDKGGPFTRDLLISTLTPVTLVGQSGTFYQFRLDVNQTSNSNNPDMTRFDLYTTNTPGQSSLPLTGNLIYSYSTLVPGVHDILVPATGSGSGQGNVDIFIPTSLFTGGNYLVLNATLTGTDDGFEEFAALQGAFTPDSGPTLMLFGIALVAAEVLRRSIGKRNAVKA